MTRNTLTEHATLPGDGVDAMAGLHPPGPAIASEYIHDKSTSADIAAHIYIPDMHGNCCCRLCMPKSTSQMDEERAARQVQHFEPETKDKWPSGWWILPAVVVNLTAWGALTFWVIQ